MFETQTWLAVLGPLLLAIIAGATASVAGFGIGSLLTPFVASQRVDMNVAIVLVAIPHAVATAIRCWRLRRGIDWTVVRSFGLLSALGGIAGSLLFRRFSDQALERVLGVLLVLTAIVGLFDLAKRFKPNRAAAGALGVASGLFGGVAGNQGGLRAAALMSFPLTPAAFVATSTLTGLLVDAARLPVYLVGSAGNLEGFGLAILVLTVGVVIGTLLGERLLLGLSPDRFRRIIAGLIGVLGIYLLV